MSIRKGGKQKLKARAPCHGTTSPAAEKLIRSCKKCQGTTGAPGSRGTPWVGAGSRAVKHSKINTGFIEDCIRNVRTNAPEAQSWLAPRFSVGKRDSTCSLRSPVGTAQALS